MDTPIHSFLAHLGKDPLLSQALWYPGQTIGRAVHQVLEAQDLILTHHASRAARWTLNLTGFAQTLARALQLPPPLKPFTWPSERHPVFNLGRTESLVVFFAPRLSHRSLLTLITSLAARAPSRAEVWLLLPTHPLHAYPEPPRVRVAALTDCLSLVDGQFRAVLPYPHDDDTSQDTPPKNGQPDPFAYTPDADPDNDDEDNTPPTPRLITLSKVRVWGSGRTPGTLGTMATRAQILTELGSLDLCVDAVGHAAWVRRAGRLDRQALTPSRAQILTALMSSPQPLSHAEIPAAAWSRSGTKAVERARKVVDDRAEGDWRVIKTCGAGHYHFAPPPGLRWVLIAPAE